MADDYGWCRVNPQHNGTKMHVNDAPGRRGVVLTFTNRNNDPVKLFEVELSHAALKWLVSSLDCVIEPGSYLD